MKPVCVIYMEDEGYAKRLMNVFSQKGNIKYGILLFTQLGELEKYLKENEPALMVVGEEDCSENCLNQIAELYTGKMVVFTEEEKMQENVTCRFGENAVGIYRYQSLGKILKQMMDISTFQYRGKLMETEIMGIYSPLCVPERSAFALNMAKVLSEQERLLYISLEEFSGLEEILPTEPDATLSDALYYYHQGQQAANDRIAQTIRSIAGVDYIAPVRCAEDVAYMDVGQIIDFICNVGQHNNYEVILLDISSAVKQPWQVLDCCSQIYLPVREDYLAKKRLKNFELYFMDMGMEYLLDRIIRVKLPEGESGIAPDFWERIEFGGMYRFVKKLLEKGRQTVG